MEHLNVPTESLTFVIHFAFGEVLTLCTRRKKEKALFAALESCEQRLVKLEEIVRNKLLNDQLSGERD